MNKEYPDVEHDILEKKALTDEMKKKLTEAISKFKEQFKSSP